ncbi:MAG: von Willebrand factor type A domain-containing protein [Acidobacteriota bacterium]
MNIDPKDPRLTAYALGELESEDERIEIERALDGSEELTQIVAQIRQTAELMTEELQKEPSPGLAPKHQQRIESELEGPGGFFSLHVGKWAFGGALAAAACLIFAAVLTPNLLQSKSDRNTVTQLYRQEVNALSSLSSTSDERLAEEADPNADFGNRRYQAEQTGALVRNEDSEMVAQMEEPATASKLRKTESESQPAASAPAAGMVGGELREVAQVGRSRGDTPAPSERGAGSYFDSSSKLPNREAATPAVVAEARPLDIPAPEFNTEAYDRIEDNQFLQATQNPLSTFSIDVDTASYAVVRRFLQGGTLPPKDAVRIEEMLNYFSYNYPVPSEEGPFSASVEVAQAPWALEHRLVRIGLKGQELGMEQRPSSNLVFLLDVSGSMQPANKLPLLKNAMRLLVDRLGEKDRVAIVVYAGASGLVLPSTSSDQKGKILAALENLRAGGSTNGGSGIRLAYQTAVSNFITGGVNRVILATDGDFNVGTTNQGDLTRLIEDNAKSGVFLTVLGFGMGNYKDSTLEKLADMGNGNYAYIDTINEARKVLVDEINATLVTIAKDVKIQIEFNPLQVSAYRLIGYENRLLRKEDFNDDTKDAGEIGAGHTVTALYEIVPAGKGLQIPGVDPLKYQTPMGTTDVAQSGELLTLKLRYKQPDGETSRLLEFPVRDGGKAYSQASQDFKFAAAVASFGMILRQSPYQGNGTLAAVLELAQEGKGSDPHGYRGEFLELVKQAIELRNSDSRPNR